MYHLGANLHKISIDITYFNIGLLKLQAAQRRVSVLVRQQLLPDFMSLELPIKIRICGAR